MSHLACADARDLGPTREQLTKFAHVSELMKRRGIVPRVRHIANSAAALRAADSRFDLVRPGIAVYGVAPCPPDKPDVDTTGPRPLLPGEKHPLADLKPVMRVRSEIVALRTIADGEHVGYGHTFRARGPRVIATIAMGYADGLSRSLSNKGSVLVRGRRAPIAGVVSMDLTSIDVTDIPLVAVGDEAVVLGPQEGVLGADEITAEEIARHAGTIPWEPLTHISRRVPRFYREP
jgi:alanine racemase